MTTTETAAERTKRLWGGLSSVSQLVPRQYDHAMQNVYVSGGALSFGQLQPLKRTPLEMCLAYFRGLGLTDEQIRKAITPALFAELQRSGK